MPKSDKQKARLKLTTEMKALVKQYNTSEATAEEMHAAASEAGLAQQLNELRPQYETEAIASGRKREAIKRAVASADQRAAHMHARGMQVRAAQLDDTELSQADRDALGITTTAEKTQARLDKAAAQADTEATRKAKLADAQAKLAPKKEAKPTKELASTAESSVHAVPSLPPVATVQAIPNTPAMLSSMTRADAEAQALAAGFPEYMRCAMGDGSETGVPRADFLMFAGTFTWLDAPISS